MKKLYLEEKWKKHSAAVQRRSLRKRKSTPVPKSFANLKFLKDLNRISIHKDTARVLAPEKFSIINNPNEMLEYFDAVHQCIRSGFKIYLDVSKVKEITFDAILYILSRMDYYRKTNFKVSFAGNRPDDPICKQMFEESGFFNHVYTRDRVKSANSDIYAIQSSGNVDPIIAKEIIDFAKSHLNDTTNLNSKGLYATLIECMANTFNHAYNKNNLKSLAKWWVMASYDAVKDKVVFSFVDNGFGIPHTLRKNYLEKIRQYLPLFENMDSQLVLSSLNGDFRTKTKLKHRGKGLPRIYRSAQHDEIQNLTIISKKAYVTAKPGKLHSDEMMNTFHGTLLTWTFS